jgi:hypothetical protein
VDPLEIEDEKLRKYYFAHIEVEENEEFIRKRDENRKLELEELRRIINKKE